MKRRRGTRRVLTAIAVVAFLVASMYAIGGSAVFRQIRSRIRAFMEPPTPEQVQRAVAEEARQATADSAARADTTSSQSDPPASLAFMGVVMTAVLTGAVALMIVSAGRAAKRD